MENGDWKRELMNLLQMKGRVSSRGVIKPISDRTLDAREAVLFMCVKQIREMGYKIKSVYSIKQKHIEALVERWKKEGIAAGTIQNRLAILRALSKWIGKDGLVLRTTKYSTVEPGRLKREVVPTRDKSWSAKGLDPAQVIREAELVDPCVAMQLKVIAAFGLRREEAIQLRPWQVDEGEFIRVRNGTKGGRERQVQVNSCLQRQVLEEAKEFVRKKKGHLGNEGLSLKQSINRFNYVMKKVGITNRKAGVTAHGLRHQRLNDLFEEIAGVSSPVRQTEAGEVAIVMGDPVKWRQAQQRVSHEAGHNRINISNAYLGTVLSARKARLNWTGAAVPASGQTSTPTTVQTGQDIPQSEVHWEEW